MTPDQIAAYIKYLQDSKSTRPDIDPERYVYLRGFNGGMEHALAWLDRNVTLNGASPLSGEVKAEPEQSDDRVGEYR